MKRSSFPFPAFLGLAAALCAALCAALGASCSSSGPAPQAPAASVYRGSALPVDASAADCAKRLKKFLADNCGPHTIAGQMDTAWDDGMDMVASVYADTGKYPALKGFDFMNSCYSSGSGSGSEQAAEANAWWNNALIEGRTDIHGIVAFCWHWRVPVDAGGSTLEFYSNKTSFRIPYDGASGGLDQPAVVAA